jgi:GT2 family glycosyltransferase
MSAGFDVSVVIPTHDAREYALEAVASALTQSLPAREILVIDDRSSDGTAQALIERYGDRIGEGPGTRLRIVSGAFGGAAAARNAGWRAARSEWVALLDADDLWFPDKLATAAATLGRVPPAGWFFSDGAFATLDGAVHPSWFALYADVPEPYAGHPLAALLEVNFILTSSLVVRRSLLETLGGFDETMSHAEDVDLWIRMARRAPATASARALVRYQHRPGSLTRQTSPRLLGSAALFQRLAIDPGLPPDLRRRARSRAAMARYKLGFSHLREGDGSGARPHLVAAFRDPGRAVAAAGAWALSWLPRPMLQGLRSQEWAKRTVAAPTLHLRRVRLESEPGIGIAGGTR